jgi:hypothetical protein
MTLHDLNGAIPAVVVAEATGWTLPRVQRAAETLTELLAPAGLTVQQQSGRLALRAVSDAHADATLAARQHPRASLSQRLVTPNRAGSPTGRYTSRSASTRSVKTTAARSPSSCAWGSSNPTSTAT